MLGNRESYAELSSQVGPIQSFPFPSSDFVIHHLSTFPPSLPITVAPSVSLPLTTTAVQGNSLTLDCNPIGQPSPTVTWYKDNVQLTSGGRVSIDGEGRLVIGSVVTLDGGSYRCEASSSVGVASATTSLTVLGKYYVSIL